MNRFITFVFATLISITFSISAKTVSYSDVLKELNTLLSNKQYEKAFKLSDEYTYEYGGLPEFDLLSGFAAYGNKHYQEAAFAFERVTSERPNSYLGRFFLAQTYQKLNNLQAAISELELLLKRPLTSNQKENATNLLTQINQTLIAKEKSFVHSVSAMTSFDSNINSGTAEEQIFIPNLGQITLFDSSRETRDLTYSLGYQAKYKHPISQSQWFNIGIAANYVDYLEYHQYQRNMFNFDFSYERKSDIGVLSVSAFTRPLWLDGNYYRTETGTNGRWAHELSKSSRLTSNLSYSIIKNDVNPTLDLSRVRMSISYLLKKNQVHNFSAHWLQDVSDDPLYEFNDKNSLGFLYQLTLPITNSIISNNSFIIEQSEYIGIHPIFLKKRNEIMSIFSSQLMFNSSKKLRLTLHLNLQNKNSNVDLFSYDRVDIGANWQYTL